MLRCDIFFVLITMIGYSAHLIKGEDVPSHTLRTVVRNTDVTLSCPHPSLEQFGQEVRWFFTAMDNPFGYYLKSIADDNHFKLDTERDSLLIRNVTIEDAGMFKCCFDSPCADIFLVVLDFENILSFKSDQDDASGEIIVSSKGDFSVTAHFGSDLNFNIVAEPNIPICNYFTRNVVCYKMKQGKGTSYYLKNAKLRNSGRFVIESSFMTFNGSYRLNILIQGKPVLNIENVPTENGIRLICRGHAYPPPVFDFHFIPFEMQYANLVSPIVLESFETTNYSTSVSATAIMQRQTSGPGTVECRASNSEGVSYAVTYLSMEHFHDENRVLTNQTFTTEPYQLQFIITPPSGTVNDGDIVHFQCIAYSYTFSNSFIFQYHGSLFPVNGILHEDTYVAKFSIIAPSDEFVICNAQLKNGSIQSKQITLPALEVNGELERESELVKGSSIDPSRKWDDWNVLCVILLLIVLYCDVFTKHRVLRSMFSGAYDQDGRRIRMNHELAGLFGELDI